MPPIEAGPENQWEADLSASLGYEVKVEFTRARSSPIQLRHATREELRKRPRLRKGWVVRLHSVFADAPPEIRADLASWIRVGRRAPRACRELGSWTEQALRGLPQPKPRRVQKQPEGLVHDLRLLTLGLLECEFRGEFEAEREAPGLTWGKRGKSRARRSLQLGSYNSSQNLIRIHPVLDQASAPRWFIRYVLFHEHLHAAIPSERDAATGKLQHHGRKFVTREKTYVDYARALAWQNEHLPKLLRLARRG